MLMHRLQFPTGLSLAAFLDQFGAEAPCEAALEEARWPDGFRCPRCGEAQHSVFRVGVHQTFQCWACHTQTSLIAGTPFQSTHLPLTIWFLAIYLFRQSQTGLSAMALMRQLDVSYPTARRIRQTLIGADGGT